MSANVETMMYVKEKPWHGQGIRVEEALNSKEALQMAGLDWTVDPKKVIVNNMVVPNYIANVRSSDEKVLGIVSDRYKVVQNIDAFEFTDAIIGNGEIDIKYESAGSLANGKKVWMLARMPKTTILGDDVEPFMVFTNSHDGSGSIKVAMTPIRVVCQNTLTLALSKAERMWTVKHMGNMESKMHEAQLTLGLAQNYMGNMEEMAELMQQITITDDTLKEYLNLAFPIPFGKNATDRKISNTNYMRDNFMMKYNSIEDVKKFGETGWKLWNVASDIIGHETSLRQTRTLSENRFMNLVDGNKTLQSTQEFIFKI